MPSRQLDLGKLEHIHNNQNLKLKTKLSIAISSTEPSPWHSSDVSDIETLIVPTSWIAGDNRVRVHVQFLLDDVIVSDVSTGEMVEDVGLMLCNSAMWPQLHFKTSLNILSKNGAQTGLSDQLSLCLTKESTEHQAVHPPRGVPSICLEAVNLVLSLSTCRRIRKQSQSQRVSNQAKRDRKRSQSSLKFFEPAGEPGEPSKGPLVVDDTPSSDHIYAASLEGGAANTGIMNSRQFTLETSVNSHSSDSFMSPLNRVKTSCYAPSQDSLKSPKHAVHEVKFDDVLRMLNDSLSIAFCDRRPRKSSGVILSRDTGFPRLDVISPALFSPGYLEAIASRSKLVSNIAHSVHRIGCRTRSSDLKQKVERLEEPLSDEYHIHSTSSFQEIGDRDNSRSDNLQARLWLLLQHKMVNPRAWPCWNPDILTKTNLTSSQRPESHMLDEELLDPVAQEGPHTNDSEYVLDSQETLFDDILDLDDNIFEDIGLVDSQCSADPRQDNAFADEDEILDEDLFWAELDVGATDQDIEKALFEDILDFGELMNGDDSIANPGAADAGAVHHEIPDDGSGISHMKSRLSQSRSADYFLSESSRMPFKEADYEPNEAFSDVLNAKGSVLLHSILGERSVDTGGGILDWSADQVLEQRYCHGEMLDETAASLNSEQ